MRGGLIAVLLLLPGFVAPASASQLIDRGTTDATLEVDAKGEALITYCAATGKTRNVLAWGAANAIQPTPGGHQVHLDVDYGGGSGKYHTTYWKTFANARKPYDGPALPYVVAACKAPDGSYCALQSWDVFYPDLGFSPWMHSQSTALTLSHWTGPLAQLDVHVNWSYGGRFRQLFGTYSHDRKPVFGYRTTQFGAPIDSFGRLVYVDTFDAPKYGAGWKRENSFTAHSGSGGFCYGFTANDALHGGYAHPSGYAGGLRGPGVGKEYRVSGEGPGVTPDVSVLVTDPGTWNAKDAKKVALEDQANTQPDQLAIPGCGTH
jgi:hypothetical protein